MNADTGGLEAGKPGDAMVDVPGALDGDAKLVLPEASGDVGMRLGEDVRN